MSKQNKVEKKIWKNGIEEKRKTDFIRPCMCGTLI